MTRFLVVSEPDRARGAGDRVLGIVEGLRACGGEVSRMTLAPLRGPLRRLRTTPWWYYKATSTWSAELKKAAAAADVVVASRLPVAACVLEALGPSTGVPVAYDAHNDEAKLIAEIAPGRRSREVERMQREVVSAAAVVWAAGARDAASLESRYPGSRVANLPNGVSADVRPIRAEPAPGSAFTFGTWAYPPNRDGLQRLASSGFSGDGDVYVFGHLPRRLRRRAERTVSATGAGPEWRFEGFAETIEAMVERAGGPGIVPVWSGSGTKLRVVQLAARGIPAHVTTEAVSGLPEWLARELQPEDDARTLLGAALSAQPEAWAHARTVAQRVVAELSWETLVAAALADSGLAASADAAPVKSQ
ncbi:MAG: polysaccharide biosynthesis protein PslH [Solirubrobacterales bacterium]|nr:polysaccharide biosynthesis protein PslH [Solirubrobacterales bacterium]